MAHLFSQVVPPIQLAFCTAAVIASFAFAPHATAQPSPSPTPVDPDPDLILSVGTNPNPCEHLIAAPQFACGPEATPAALTGCSTHALYAFSQDTPGTAPKCGGACAEQWPPVIVAPRQDVRVNPPLQSGIAGSVPRPAEASRPSALQEVYGGHPLYRFVGDQTEKDTLGQCVKAHGGTFQLVKPDGTLCPCDSQASSPPVPAPVPPSCPGGSCGGCAPPTVCGWTPGYKCPSFSNVSNCDPTCCVFDPAWLFECPGRNACNNSSGGGCGTPTVCGWTPGYKCPRLSNVSNCDPTCCQFDPAWLSECPGRPVCGG